MSATREYNNAATIEEAADALAGAAQTVSRLYDALSHALPDDFPAIGDDIIAVTEACDKLRRAVES